MNNPIVILNGDQVYCDELIRISTHAPLAGRDVLIKEAHFTDNISTHAPLAGRDRMAGSH